MSLKSYKSMVLGAYPDCVCDKEDRADPLLYEISRDKKFVACGTSAAAAWRNAAVVLGVINEKGERL